MSLQNLNHTNQVSISRKLFAKIVACVLLFVLMDYFYFESLEPCPHDPPEVAVCLKWIKTSMNSIMIRVIYASLCYLAILVISLKRIISLYVLLIFTVNLIWLWNYQKGMNLTDHGGINRLGLILFILVVVAAYGLLRCAIWVKRKGRYVALLVISIILLNFLLFYYTFVKDSGEHWKYGLHGAKIEPIDGVCTVLEPHYCELSIREGWLDFNRFVSECSKQSMVFKTSEDQLLIKNKPNVKRIGYPRVEYLPNEIQLSEIKMK